jgi:hypothetical protein
MIDLDEFARIEHTMQAFTIKDLQTAVTILSWMSHHTISVQDMFEYLEMFPILQQLRQVGYFVVWTDPVSLKRIRDFERLLPQNVRKALRKERLKQLVSGPLRTKE